MNLTELKNTPVSELVQLGESMGLENLARAHKNDIIFAILKAHAVASLQKPMGGFLVYAIVAAIVNALFPAACAAEEEPGFAGVAAGTAEGGNE